MNIMGKSMVTEKIRISPYLHREITNLVDDGDFASFSDFVNIAVSSFLSRNFDLNEEEDQPSLEMPLALLYLTLIDNGIITKEDISGLLEKVKNDELDTSILEDFFCNIAEDFVEYDFYDMLDNAKQMEKEKSYDSAEKIYLDVIEMFPEDFEPNFSLGCLYVKTGKEDEGRTQLEIALQKANEMEEEEDIIEMISSEINKMK
jgi:Arc/MetJ-type ribon-helix-helix transcriptional regulator